MRFSFLLGIILLACQPSITVPRVIILAQPVYNQDYDELAKPSISDYAQRIELRWPGKPQGGAASFMLYDAADNPVVNKQFDNWLEQVPVETYGDSTSTIFNYNPSLEDKPGTWRFTFQLNGKELLTHTYEVLPAQQSRDSFAEEDCFLTDGKLNLANFYQLAPAQIDFLNEEQFPLYSLIPSLKYELQKRLIFCMTPEYTGEQFERWEYYLEKLSGISPRNHEPSIPDELHALMPGGQEFFFVNPAFVTWVSKNMIPNPRGSQLNGWLFQQIYDEGLIHHVRSLALIGLYYRQLPDRAHEAKLDYARAATRYVINDHGELDFRSDNVYLPAHIDSSHKGPYYDWVSSNDLTHLDDGYNFLDVGFWLRRGIDGSDEALWTLLCDVLKIYDAEWFNRYIKPTQSIRN